MKLENELIGHGVAQSGENPKELMSKFPKRNPNITTRNLARITSTAPQLASPLKMPKIVDTPNRNREGRSKVLDADAAI